ncbi:MAG: protein tyrosine phosphatase [Verrucomicrobia bacterium]|nr:MAG: protein tyrosine phosphatase [Verrucomicrobiota bacterium]
MVPARRPAGPVRSAPSVPNPVKLLFVCSLNRWRSPTAEALYQGFPGYVARSAGTEPGARIRVTEGLLGWADWIFCMERRHVDCLRAKFPEAIAGKRVVCLRIGDDFPYGHPELVASIQSALSGHVDVPGP